MTVEIKGVNEPAKAMKVIKETLGKDMRTLGPVKNLFPVEGGRVVIRCNDDSQKQKISTTFRERN